MSVDAPRMSRAHAVAKKLAPPRPFTGEGGPISLHLDGTDQAGYAVARRAEKGRVTVRLDR